MSSKVSSVNLLFYAHFCFLSFYFCTVLLSRSIYLSPLYLLFRSRIQETERAGKSFLILPIQPSTFRIIFFLTLQHQEATAQGATLQPVNPAEQALPWETRQLLPFVVGDQPPPILLQARYAIEDLKPTVE